MGGLKNWLTRVSTAVHVGINATRADDSDKEEMHERVNNLESLASGLILGVEKRIAKKAKPQTVRIEIIDERKR